MADRPKEVIDATREMWEAEDGDGRERWEEIQTAMLAPHLGEPIYAESVDEMALIDACKRIAELETLLHDAFNAGMAYSTGSGRDFAQTYPDRETWVRKALGGTDA